MVRHAHAHKHLQGKKKKDFFDYALYFFVVATPMFELSQAWEIYTTKDAHGVSLATWSFFFFSSIVWLVYAARNKIVPLMVAYSLYLCAEGIIVIGILKYS